MDAWTEFIAALTILRRQDLRTLPAQIINFMGFQRVEWGPVMAYSVLVGLPEAVLVILVQHQIIGSLTTGVFETTSTPLNGTWEFRLDPDDVGRAQGWHEPEAPGDWATIEVPAMWQVAGHPDYNGWAWYRLRFRAGGRSGEVPSISPLRRLLRFRDVSYWAEAWLNGAFLRSHDRYFAPFEFDVTEVLQGWNTLVVRCGSPLEEWQKTVRFFNGKDKRTTLGALQDWDCIPYPTQTNPSGIWRDVTLDTTGPAFIRHTDLATLSHDHAGQAGYDGPASARMELRLTLVNLAPRTRAARVRLTFTPRDHRGSAQVVKLGPLDLMHHTNWWLYEGAVPSILEDVEHAHTFHFQVPEVRLWWPWDLGAQNLYDVAVEVWLGETLSDRRTLSFGFRTVEKGLNDPAIDRWNWARNLYLEVRSPSGAMRAAT